MSKNVSTQWQPSNPARLARQFSRLGWIGFWMQLVLITVPVLLLIYVLFFARPDSAQSRGIDLSNYLSYGGLMVMVFTTFWFYRYTRLAERIADPAKRPSLKSVVRTLWIGLWASCLGIVFSMLLLLSAVARLLFILMTMPQTGIPIAAVSGCQDTVCHRCGQPDVSTDDAYRRVYCTCLHSLAALPGDPVFVHDR